MASDVLWDRAGKRVNQLEACETGGDRVSLMCRFMRDDKAPAIKKVYVVWGQSGEYSDRNEWPVCFYLNEEAGQRHVEKASARAIEIQEQLRADDCMSCYVSTGPASYCEKHKNIKNEFDPNVQWRDPIRYCLMEVSAGPEA